MPTAMAMRNRSVEKKAKCLAFLSHAPKNEYGGYAPAMNLVPYKLHSYVFILKLPFVLNLTSNAHCSTRHDLRLWLCFLLPSLITLQELLITFGMATY